MVTAERWHEYQDLYNRHGIDMSVKKEKVEREMTATIGTGVNSKEKILILFLTIIVGIVGISLILATAYSANIKYNINTMIKENTVIQGEIENLNVKIKTGTNLEIVEQRAKAELGMVPASAEQFVFIDEDAEPVKDFALALKERAYN